MNIVLTTDYTTTDLVTLADAKQQLRIASTYDDNNVNTLLDAARQIVESETNRAILNQTWTLYLDYFPDVIYLPKGIIQSVTSVKYIDTGGTQQTLADGTDYTTTTGIDDGRIVPTNNGWVSDVNTEQNNVVEIIFVAGYGATKTAETSWAEQAILMKLSQLYYNLDSSMGYENLVNLKRHYSLAEYRNHDRRSVHLR